MEGNLTDNILQQQEFDKIDAMLPALMRKCLLTEIECRLIASSNCLWTKRGAVYAVIMSKPEDEAVILTKAFRKMTVTIHTEENTTSLPNTSSNENTNSSILPSKNPFLNNTIIKYLFGFLPLADLKRSRLVCRQWNSTVEICLRKRSIIHFNPMTLLPRTFMEISKYSHPDLPYPSFAFSSDENLRWHISDMQEFFEKWKNNIKEVTFNSFILTIQCHLTGKRVRTVNHDVTPLFINPSNITTLIIKTTEEYEAQPRLNICLEEFVSIKTLSLNDCIIIMSEKDQRPAIAPHSVNFNNIAVKQNGKFVTSFYYNNVVDFSKAVNIRLDQHEDDPLFAYFDLSKQVFNVNQLHLINVEMINWHEAKGNVEFLRLYGELLETNHLKFKLLDFTDSQMLLNALPQTLEILHMAVGIVEVICIETLYLPNLKYLCIDMREIDCLVYFSNCPNLVSLQIRNEYRSFPPAPCVLNLANVPKSVKIMRMILPVTIEFTDTDDCILQLDSFILSHSRSYRNSDLKDFKKVTDQIKSKVLVVVFNEDAIIDTSDIDIVKLVLANMQSEKILIGCKSDLHKTTPFEGSELSKCVDRKSNYYQFENSFGKSITQEQFERYAAEDICFPSYFQ